MVAFAPRDAAFIQTIAINGGIATVMLVVFCFLRYRLRQRAPSAAKDGFLAWLVPTLRTSDRDILYHHGLDAAMFSRFISSLGICFMWMLLFSLLVLMPVDLVGSNRSRSPFDDQYVEGLSVISMSNIDTKHQTHLLWPHFLSVFIFSGILMGYMFRDFRKFSRYRAFIRSFEIPSNYSVLVSGFPKGMRGVGDAKTADRQLGDYFRTFFEEKVKYGTVSSHFKFHEPKITELIMEFNAVERELEKSQWVLANEGTRPMRRTGKGPARIWPPWKEKTDAITWLTTRRADILTEVGQLQSSTEQKINGVGFVVFNDMLSAATAAQLNYAKNRYHFMTEPGPDPRDINWSALHIKQPAKIWRRAIVYVFFFFLIFFWSIPGFQIYVFAYSLLPWYSRRAVLFAASLANLEAIARLAPFRWLQPILDINPNLTDLIQGLLPVIVVNVFFALLLTIIGFAASFIGFYRKSELDECVRNVYFLFLLFNVFLVYTIGGSLLTKVNTYLNANLSLIVTLLAQSIPVQAYFFTSYVMTNSLVGFSMLIMRPVGLILWWLKGKFLAKSPLEKLENDKPPPFLYGPFYARAALISVLVLAYSTMFPIILVFGSLYFFYLYLSFRYNVAYVYVQSYEGFGQQYPFAFTAVVIGLYIYQFTMFGVLSLSRFWAAPVLLLCPLATYLYHGFVMEQFDRSVNYGSLNAIKGEKALAKEASTGIEPARKFKGVERDHNRTYEAAATHNRYTLMLDLSYHGDGQPSESRIANIESRASVRARNPYAQPERKPLLPLSARDSSAAPNTDFDEWAQRVAP